MVFIKKRPKSMSPRDPLVQSTRRQMHGPTSLDSGTHSGPSQSKKKSRGELGRLRSNARRDRQRKGRGRRETCRLLLPERGPQMSDSRKFSSRSE